MSSYPQRISLLLDVRFNSYIYKILIGFVIHLRASDLHGAYSFKYNVNAMVLRFNSHSARLYVRLLKIYGPSDRASLPLLLGRGYVYVTSHISRVGWRKIVIFYHCVLHYLQSYYASLCVILLEGPFVSEQRLNAKT